MIKMQDRVKSYKVSDLEFEKMNEVFVANKLYNYENSDEFRIFNFDDKEQWYYNPVELELLCNEDFKEVEPHFKREIKCKNIGLHHCNKYVHNIIDKMLSKKHRIYLFNWDDVPGKDSAKFKHFLKQCYGLDWLENLEFKKNNDKIISIYDDYHYLKLIISNEKITL